MSVHIWSIGKKANQSGSNVITNRERYLTVKDNCKNQLGLVLREKLECDPRTLSKSINFLSLTMCGQYETEKPAAFGAPQALCG